jgi:uncharacterized protein (TIGR02246 family)
MLKLIGVAIVCLIGLTSPVLAEDVRQAIEQANARMVKAFKAGDAAAIAALFAEDAKMLPPDATEVAGRRDIQQLWQGWIDGGLKDLTLQSIEVAASGELAYEIGNFSLQAPADNDAMTTTTGNYLVVWKHGTDGQWRLQVDTWNEATTE